MREGETEMSIDAFGNSPSMTHDEMVAEGLITENGDATEKGTARIRLEYLRGELRAERISMGELLELQGLAPYIDEGDVELREAADLPEYPSDVETIVDIPGEFSAHYKNGAIIGFTFIPHASNAGYFGPAARVSEGDAELDVEETDGPFWRALQAKLANDELIPEGLAGTHFACEWQE
jgi:hypothetical protein